MSNIVYLYNPFTFVYEGEGKLHSCQRTLKETGVIFYMPRANSTTIQPTLENYKTPYFNLETNEWELRDNKIQGIFYNIASGDKVDGILQKDELLYTMDEPFDKMEGDKMKYVDGIFGINYETGRNTLINGKWIFESKSDKRQITELTTTLLADLEIKYNETKTIKVINGHSFIISVNSKEYDVFISIIEDACKGINADETREFQMFEKNGDEINIRLKNIFWKIVFQEFYNNRIANKISFNRIVNKINYAKTLNELSSISLELPHNQYIVNVTNAVIKIDEAIKKQLAGGKDKLFTQAQIDAFNKYVPDIEHPLIVEYIPFN
jgi:hypothetical protein